MGPRTKDFEREFADHLGVPRAVAVSSSTAALHLAYLAAGVGPGDEVIVPGITFVATAAAARYCGGTPVLAEVLGQHDLGLDPDDVAARITSRTKAVCLVHYAGYAAPLEPLRRLCEEHGLALIEDAAHSPDHRARGRAQARDDRASRGVQLLLEQDLVLRRAVWWRRPTTEIPQVELPYTAEQVAASSCYVMPLVLRDPNLRDPLRRLLSERFGIQTTVLYPSINEFSAYRDEGRPALPRCERAARTQLTVPLYPHLGEEHQDRVVASLRDAVAELSR